jgi:flagellar motility protein MotE (MotC chaperone)
MSRIPRLLPLIAIAAGGVIAVKAVSGIEGVPDFLAGARAFAEEAAGRAPEPETKAEETPTSAPEPTAPKAVAACAPSAAQLAQDAGLSPAELQVLQSLSQRRGQLDEREQEMDTQLQLLTAAEAKLDAKLRALSGLKGEMQALMGQIDEREKAEIARLVTVYSKMRPREAAPILVQLSDRVRLPVAAAMKETNLAAIMSQMPPAEAKKLTESLASRFDQAQTQAQALATAAGANPPAANAAAPPGATPPAAPAARAAAPGAAAPPG